MAAITAVLDLVNSIQASVSQLHATVTANGGDYLDFSSPPPTGRVGDSLEVQRISLLSSVTLLRDLLMTPGEIIHSRSVRLPPFSPLPSSHKQPY